MPKHWNNKFFISAVSREFGSYRTELVRRLTRPNVDVKVQEDFLVSGGTTLQKLDTYIQNCSAVVHLIGDATGAVPPVPEVRSILARYPDLPVALPVLAELLSQPDPGITYTQWEVYLAIYHQRQVYIYRPTEHAPRDQGYQPNSAEQAAQALHYERICALGRDRGQFEDVKDLSSNVMRDLLDILAHENSQQQTLAGRLSNLWRRFFGPIDARIHAFHCRIHPINAQHWSTKAGELFWIALALRVCAVALTIVVLWRFYHQIEKGSLHGIQQGIFLGVAFFVNLMILGWQRIPRQWNRLLKLAGNDGWKAKPWKFAGHAIDLALLPLELTCVIATIPITIERWMKDLKKEEWFIHFALIVALGLAILAVQVVRYWPFYRHACRSLLRGQPPGFALAINWLLAGWFLFNPLLLPTGAVATFHTAGSTVLQVAADSATDEIAVASSGENVLPNNSQATTIQTVLSPMLKFQPASFQGVPWKGNDLLQMVFHDRNISVMRGELYGPKAARDFLIWNRREKWGHPSVVPNLSFSISDIWIDSTGSVIMMGYKAAPGAAKSPTVRDMILNLDIEKSGPGENAKTESHPVPAIAISAPREEIHWVESPWLEGLQSIIRVDRSDDGRFLVATGILPSLEKSTNPYVDDQLNVIAQLEIDSGNVVWEQKSPKQNIPFNDDLSGENTLSFSPDGQRILKSKSSGIYAISHETTYSLLDASTGELSSSFSADAGDMIWSPDSSHLALRCEQRIEIYDAVSTAHIKTYYVPRGKYLCHAFTNDGKHLAAGGDQGTLWLYELPAE